MNPYCSDRIALQAATIFGIIAGTLVNLMIVVQSAIHPTIPTEARESLGLAYAVLNTVQHSIFYGLPNADVA